MTSGQETERIYFYNSGAHMGVCDSAWTSVVLIGLELCLSILTAIFQVYNIRPGNGAGLYLQHRSPHGAMTTMNDAIHIN